MISIPAKTCNVVIILNGISETLTKSYTYDSNLTSTVTDVTPTRGGTGGGTVLTITGSGFGLVALTSFLHQPCNTPTPINPCIHPQHRIKTSILHSHVHLFAPWYSN